MTEVSLFAAVFAGAASFISPCVLPLLPGYVSLMSGYSMKELSEGTISTRRVVGTTALFVLGFTVIFVLVFGAAASSVGNFLNQSIWTTIAGWVIVAMGLFIAVTAVWQPAVLLPFMRERRFEMHKANRLGFWAPPVMGAAFAFGWTPCIGPFLAVAMSLGASADTVGQGMLVMFFYSLGLGIPFLVTSLALTRAFSAFNWIKRYLTPITVVSGLSLAAFGLIIVTGNINMLSSFFTTWLERFGLDRLAEI